MRWLVILCRSSSIRFRLTRIRPRTQLGPAHPRRAKTRHQGHAVGPSFAVTQAKPEIGGPIKDLGWAWVRAAPPCAMSLVPQLSLSVKTVIGLPCLKFSVRKNNSGHVTVIQKHTQFLAGSHNPCFLIVNLEFMIATMTLLMCGYAVFAMLS